MKKKPLAGTPAPAPVSSDKAAPGAGDVQTMDHKETVVAHVLRRLLRCLRR